MFRQIGLLLLSIVALLVISCKNEVKNETFDNESLDVIAERSNVEKAERRELTPEEKEKANSVMARLVTIPETKKFARYAITANMMDKLSNEKGPFTIFSVSNDVLERLPEAKRRFYSDQKNLSQLVNLLNSHIVEGNYNEESLRNTIKKEGKAKLKTLDGSILALTESEGNLIVSDENGRKASVQKIDSPASNGQIFIIDAVLNLP